MKGEQHTLWVPLWHIYQPPNQSPYWVKKVAQESYEAIIALYKKHPHAKCIININGSLTLLLQKYGLQHIIDGLKELGLKGQVEFVSSLAYHAIAPLLPEEEIIRQIRRNDAINKEAFGDAYQPTGVWLPEMAYSPDVIKPIAELGYQWISLAGVASNGNWTNNTVHKVSDGTHTLNVLFRDDHLSLDIAFGRLNTSFMDLLRHRSNTYVFTTMDGETIGHHIRTLTHHLDTWLSVLEQDPTLSSGQSKDIFKRFPEGQLSIAHPSSWSTTYEDIKAENYFPLWLEQYLEPYKSAHALSWEHLYTVLDANKFIKEKIPHQHPLYQQARSLLDECMFSCSYWWFTREEGHRASPRLLANLDMQAKVMRLFLTLNNSPSMQAFAEKTESLRAQVYQVLNDYAYEEASVQKAKA